MKRLLSAVKGPRRFSLLCLLAASLSFLVSTAHAATFTVSKIADTADGTCDADCSLREAITAANNAAGDDTITFDATVFNTAKTITLGGTELNINSNIAINGPAARVTISANQQSRVFRIDSGVVSMDGLTISNGYAVQFGGGCILNMETGNLTLTNSTVSGGLTGVTGSGICNVGTMAITNCTISGNFTYSSGGGVSNNEVMTISNSTISGNDAVSGGGGVFNSKSLTITNSTISGNRHTGNNLVDGGGAILDYNTGGINSGLTLDSCTITNNSSPNIAGGLRGGIWLVHGTYSSRNCIVWGNGAEDLRNETGTVTSNGHNLIGTGNAAASFNATGDQTGVADAKLGALANNGGPTQTHAVLAGSPAINAGDTTQTTDQRGVPRPTGSADDIGAFEVDVAQSGTNFVVNTADDSNDGTCGVGYCSLREAITAANATSGTVNITFDSTMFATAKTITLGGTQLPLITRRVNIDGPAAGVTVNANNASRVMQIDVGAIANLQRLTLTGGQIFLDGGGIYSEGDLSLTDCNVSGNVSFSSGGGIYNNAGSLSLTNSTISGNSAANSGGGFYTNSNAFLTNSTICDNQVTSGVSGGAFLMDGALGDVSMDSCTVTNNTAVTGSPNSVGGIDIQGSTLTVYNSIVSGNSTSDVKSSGIVNSNGYNLIGNTNAPLNFGFFGDQTGITDAKLGPLANNGGLTLTRAVLPDSPARDTGDASQATDQRGVARPFGSQADIGAFELVLNESLVVTTTADEDDNTSDPAYGSGTSLREAINYANSRLDDSTITFDATVFGTVKTITLGGTALPTINNNIAINGPSAGVTISGNNASGVFQIDFGVVSMDKLTITNGASADNGGAIVNNDTLTLTNCTISDSSATNLGGGVYNNGTLTATNCTFSGNAGEGIYSTFRLTVTNCTFSSNGTGLLNTNTLTATNCTFNDNLGEGIRNLGGTITCVNGTFSGNATGISANSGAVDATNCTIVGNSGSGIISNSTVNLRNSLSVGNGTNVQGTLGGGSVNVIVAGTTAAVGLDPAGLQDNGGPVKTIALVSSSGTAFNAGSNLAIPSGITTDARGAGFPRILVNRVDIGAYELDVAVTESLVVTTTADENNGTSDSAFGTGTSLREAIDYANRNPGDDTITFSATTFGTAQTLTAVGTQFPIISSNITINGPAAGLTLSGNNTNRVFEIASGSTVSLDKLTIIAGKTTLNANGGGILNSGTLTLTNSTLTGNVGNTGSGLYNDGTATVTNCTFTGNQQAGSGGGIYTLGSLAVTNCTFVGNSAKFGGAISASGPTTITNCTMLGNTSTSGGDNVRTDATVVLKNSIVLYPPLPIRNISGTVAYTDGGNNITTGTTTDAGLDPAGLQNNGGPVQTIALISGSPAINAGNNASIPSGVTTDARGSARIKGVKVDIGAVEADGLLINNVVVTEGNSGLADVTFDVTLSAAATSPVTVDYATGVTSSYPATPDVDFVSKTGSLGFAIGETSKQITVQVKGDTVYEGLERFAVNLSNASGALLIDGEGSVNIQDDDSASTLRISDVTQAEGNSGTTDFVFTVSLTTPSSKTVSVTAAMGTTSTNAATANVDYVPLSPTVVTFAPGETSKQVTVQVNGDLLNENNERFSVKLSGAVNAPISDSEGVGTITNDDALPTLRINDVSLSEGNTGQTAFTFTVTLSAASAKTVTVKYATASASVAPATANVDYVAVPLTTLTFLPGETSKQITVLVNGDTVVESNERFGVRLSNAVNAAIADTEGLGLILNDDVATLLAPSPFTDEAPSE